MIYSSKVMESRAVLDTVAKVCAAARTAPKTRGMDGLVTCVLTGDEKTQLAAHMRKLADELKYAFFSRDADNLDAADAVVLFGMEEVQADTELSSRLYKEKDEFYNPTPMFLVYGKKKR